MTQSDYNMLEYIIDMFGTSLSDGMTYRDGLSNIFTVCSSDWGSLTALIDEYDYSILIHGTTIYDLELADNVYQYTKFLDSNYLSSTKDLSSMNFSYGDLSDFMADNTEKAMGLGSMSHESKYHYSKKNHEHKGLYSKVQIGIPKDTDLVVPVANISVTTDNEKSSGKTVKYTLKVPKVEYNLPPEPFVGTLKFVMIPQIDTTGMIHANGLYNIDINANDFDGWVYPNGFKYAITKEDLNSRFSLLQSAELIEGSGNNLSIHLPCLSNYFRLNPNNGDLSATQKVDYYNAVPNHAHTINSMSISGRIKTVPNQSLVENTKSTYKDGTRVHNGGGTTLPNPQQVHFTISCRDIQFNNLKLANSQSSLNRESEPNHYLMPVMMYIGGRKKSYYQD